LEYDLEPTSTDGPSYQLIAVTVGLVPSHREVGKETLYRFFIGNTVPAKLIAFKVVFVSQGEPFEGKAM
jgi:hypothetical protein